MKNSFGAAKKVMMVGIDGYDPTYAKPLLDAGRLPNIKKFMQMGATTADMSLVGCVPNYTPPGWCSMATGAWPGTHGITCFWNHTLGEPLDKLSFSFDSKKCEATWIYDHFSKLGKKTIVIGWPTTWPPTNDSTILIDGSGNQIFQTESEDYEKFMECTAGDFLIKFYPHKANISGADCFVSNDVADDFKPEYAEEKNDNTLDWDDTSHRGAADIIETPIKPAHGWAKDVGNAKEVLLLVNSGRERRYGLIIAEDGVNYSKVEIYKSKKEQEPIGSALAGAWTDAMRDQFRTDRGKVNVCYRFRVIELKKDGSFLRMYGSFASNLDTDNHVFPAALKKELFENVGLPMLMSNSGRKSRHTQLMSYEANIMAFRYTMDVIDYLLDNKEWDLALHGVHICDVGTHRFLPQTTEEYEDRELNKYYLEKIYELADEYVGRCLKWLNRGDTAIIVASDHGGLLMGDNSNDLGSAWHLNIGVMEELGYTVMKEVNGQRVVDWSKTRAIAQRSSYIYVNLAGRDPEGIVEPEDYDQLVEQIINDLYSYREPKTNRRIVGIALNREDMELVNLRGKHVGDIFYTMTNDFAHDQGNSLPFATRQGTSIKCLFLAGGPGIKKNVVINKKVDMVDLVPTLCYLAGVDIPESVDGKVIHHILD